MLLDQNGNVSFQLLFISFYKANFVTVAACETYPVCVEIGVVRYLSGDILGQCRTFGESMPGVGCTQTVDGLPSKGCIGSSFRPHTLYPMFTNTNWGNVVCTAYGSSGCVGKSMDFGAAETDYKFGESSDTTIRSFKCVSYKLFLLPFLFLVFI